ncbi:MULTISPECIES: RIP metalloprotease RseP [unclassified Chelatococcus]|uniref:RIP metalloprotease RseP n=1 Tax=unclassified Chelatococcus TaxID=2638111 RepID=UPI001BD1514F|nr:MULTISPECIES: RIP metalloprotease RseP [unclassified Chelatococcus]MBS7699291.1 RIP metalloprotease RseP [Chelatococcus sp. YT9]MBX3557577.1 RIP metalloprotease RseP [Chelatococcus sp.]
MEFLSAMGATATALVGYVVPFLFVLTIVVFIHELGHFLVGRWCGVGVQAFSIGFGRELIGWTDRRGTRWKLSAIPLGGYVKFAGDANAASMPDRDRLDQLTPEERKVSFFHKSVGRRAAIVAAGPVANFLLAIAIFGGAAYFNGRQVLVPKVAAVQENSAAARAGFQAGDIVLAIDGQPIASFNDMQRIVSGRAEEELTFLVDRAGHETRLTATPDLREITTPFGKQRLGMLGLQAASNDPANWHVQRFGLVEAVGVGLSETWFIVTRTYDYVAKLVTGRESTDQLSGPIRIAEVSGKVASMGGIFSLINLAAILSVSIGLINLVPIPLLDGGHLLFYAIEALRGRPLSEAAQEIGFRIGLAIVVMLMLFVTWNDLTHLGLALSQRGT